MKIGFLGSGSMAGALARGIGEPALFTSKSGTRAKELAQELGGTYVESNGELADASDVVFLGHKPKVLDEVAQEIAGRATAIVSVVAATPLSELERLYPDIPVYRIMASIPAEIGEGVILWAEGSHAADGPTQEVRELLGRCGTVTRTDDSQFEQAMALMGCGPAFLALVVEALADAGVEHGLEREAATSMVAETMAATAAYIQREGLDPGELRRRVATPGGLTEKGLGVLEERGLPESLGAAVDFVVESTR